MCEEALQQEASPDLSELPTDLSDLPEMAGKYLTFWSGGQLFGMSIAQVVQIIQVQEITPLPEFPNYIKGIICLRGEMIPVMDMRLRLGKEEKEYDDHTCIVIISVDGHSFGLVVDGVESVEDLPDDEIMSPPEHGAAGYLIGIAQRQSVILLLDVACLLGTEEISALLDIKSPNLFQ